MANNFTRNPWFINVASSNFIRSGTATPAGKTGGSFAAGQWGTSPQSGNPYLGLSPVVITSITWSGYTAGATDQVIINDENGNPIFSTFGHADKTLIQVIFSPPLPKWDFSVPTLSTGALTISLAAGTGG